MSRVIDITGVIREGMWNYDPPYPTLKIRPMPPVPWVKGKVYCEIFEGMHSQTGTYLETPAHFYGNDNPCTCLLIDVPVEKLVNAPCVVLNLRVPEKMPGGVRHPVTAEALRACSNAGEIREGDAILVGTGWGRRWMDPDYVNGGPFFTKDAMEWLLSKKPLLIGGDSATWENPEKPEGFFPQFYAAGVLMLAPLVNLESVTANRCRLTVLPLKVVNTSCAPARAVVVEE